MKQHNLLAGLQLTVQFRSDDTKLCYAETLNIANWS